MELTGLAQFVVDDVAPASANGDAVVVGRFSHLRGVRNDGGYLYRRPGPSIAGALVRMPATPGEAVEFRTPDLALAPEMRPGVAYPWVDRYWQVYHVDMVLAGRWKARTFAAAAAHRFRLRGIAGWQPVGAPVPEGAEDLGVREGGGTTSIASSVRRTSAARVPQRASSTPTITGSVPRAITGTRCRGI